MISLGPFTHWRASYRGHTTFPQHFLVASTTTHPTRTPKTTAHQGTMLSRLKPVAVQVCLQVVDTAYFTFEWSGLVGATVYTVDSLIVSPFFDVRTEVRFVRVFRCCPCRTLWMPPWTCRSRWCPSSRSVGSSSDWKTRKSPNSRPRQCRIPTINCYY